MHRRRWPVIVAAVAVAALLSILLYTLLASHQPASDHSSNTPSGAADRVDVVYFHRTQRCYSCLYVETGARHTVEDYFEDELASGTVTFQTVNVQDQANGDIVRKYGAYTSSLFVNTIKDGADHIEEATEVYFLIGRDEAFVEALKSRIEKSLNGEA
ncbi:MAG: nitrophenyl compound nitroreductase subunit ArsF family protein [Dehalococcoidia bacterium]